MLSDLSKARFNTLLHIVDESRRQQEAYFNVLDEVTSVAIPADGVERLHQQKIKGLTALVDLVNNRP